MLMWQFCELRRLEQDGEEAWGERDEIAKSVNNKIDVDGGTTMDRSSSRLSFPTIVKF